MFIVSVICTAYSVCGVASASPKILCFDQELICSNFYIFRKIFDLQNCTIGVFEAFYCV